MQKEKEVQSKEKEKVLEAGHEMMTTGQEQE